MPGDDGGGLPRVGALDARRAVRPREAEPRVRRRTSCRGRSRRRGRGSPARRCGRTRAPCSSMPSVGVTKPQYWPIVSGCRPAAAPASCHATGVLPRSATIVEARAMKAAKSSGSVPEGLVAADVEVRTGGQAGELAEHVGEEVVGRLVVDLQRREADRHAVVRHARGRDARRRATAAISVMWSREDGRLGELGVREPDGVRVAGHVDLGHDDHVTGCRVRDDLAVVARPCRSRPDRRRPTIPTRPR